MCVGPVEYHKDACHTEALIVDQNIILWIRITCTLVNSLNYHNKTHNIIQDIESIYSKFTIF